MPRPRATLHPYGHGGDIRTAAAVCGAEAENILDFSANLNPLGPPAGLLEYLAAKLPLVAAYPDPACRGLLEAIGGLYRPAGTVVAGNGAGELIYLLPRAVPPGPVLLPVPSFILYEKAARAAGRQIIYHVSAGAGNFAPDIRALTAKIRRYKPALTMVCNPNNPTGTLMDRRDVLRLAEACAPAGGYLAVDEAFLEFVPDWSERTVLRERAENIIVLCSLTKMYAMAGLRLGFMAAPSGVADFIKELRDPWSVNTLAQLAGEFVLRSRDFASESAGATAHLAAHLAAALAAIPALRVYKPAANYILLESRTLAAKDVQERLLRAGILIRDCGNYRGLDRYFFRVAVRGAADNERLAAEMKKVFK